MSIKLIENNEVIIVFQPASLPVNKREQTKVIDRESNRNARWIKQAISIRQTTPIMNRDEGEWRIPIEPRMGRPACNANYGAEELVVP